MKICVIGSGNIGRPLGLAWAKAGHHVMFGSRGGAAKPWADETKAEFGTVEAALRFADTVLLAIPFSAVSDLPGADSFAGRVVLDATNPYKAGLAGFGTPDGSTGYSVVCEHVGHQAVVKVFNTMGAANLTEKAFADPRVVAFLSGGRPAERDLAAQLVLDAGFDPWDLGGPDSVYRQEPRGHLYTRVLTRTQASPIVSLAFG